MTDQEVTVSTKERATTASLQTLYISSCTLRLLCYTTLLKKCASSWIIVSVKWVLSLYETQPYNILFSCVFCIGTFITCAVQLSHSQYCSLCPPVPSWGCIWQQRGAECSSLQPALPQRMPPCKRSQDEGEGNISCETIYAVMTVLGLDNRAECRDCIKGTQWWTELLYITTEVSAGCIKTGKSQLLPMKENSSMALLATA